MTFCTYCKKPFEEGEVLTFYPDSSFYHTIFDNEKFESRSCLIKHFPHPTHKITYGFYGIYHNGELYEPSRVVGDGEDADIESLLDNPMMINDSGNGCRLKGDIEMLLKGYNIHRIKPVVVE